MNSAHVNSASVAAAAAALERHFRPKDLAELWALDESTVRRMFQDVPGVLRIGKSERRDGRRDYVSLRIPESVAVRVHSDRSKVRV